MTQSLDALLGLCPRCAQSPEERRRDHRTKHLPDCEGKVVGRPSKAKELIRTLSEAPPTGATLPATTGAALPATTGRESAKRITEQVRSGLMSVFERLGGEAALLAWAQENPSTFFSMWSKAVPRESEANSRGAGITVNIATSEQLRAARAGRVIDAEVIEAP